MLNRVWSGSESRWVGFCPAPWPLPPRSPAPYLGCSQAGSTEGPMGHSLLLWHVREAAGVGWEGARGGRPRAGLGKGGASTHSASFEKKQRS